MSDWYATCLAGSIARRGFKFYTPAGMIALDDADDRQLGYLCERLGIEARPEEDAEAVRDRIRDSQNAYFAARASQCEKNESLARDIQKARQARGWTR